MTISELLNESENSLEQLIMHEIADINPGIFAEHGYNMIRLQVQEFLRSKNVNVYSLGILGLQIKKWAREIISNLNQDPLKDPIETLYRK